MKAGRNDPCPCGSGQKFKKCCLRKSEAEVDAAYQRASVAATPPPSFQRTSSRAETLPASREIIPELPPRPLDPLEVKRDSCWEEFESQDAEGRIAVFLRSLDDKDLLTDDMAFEMLSLLNADEALRGQRARFVELLRTLAERQPDLYEQSAPYYLMWRLQDAIVENSQEIPALAKDLAANARRDFHTFNRALHCLAYHGHVEAIVDAMRIAWPLMQTSSDILDWALSDFAEKGSRYEVYNYLEHTPSPDPLDPALLDRIKFYIAEPKLEIVAWWVDDLSGRAANPWTLEDFSLNPLPKKHRDDRDDDEPLDSGTRNLSRLIFQCVGYRRREEGVAYSRSELGQGELLQHFIRRQRGTLDPRPNMLELARNPKKKLPKPPKPDNPLCPERVTLEVHLVELLDLMNGLYHTAAAMFEFVSAWLRFLEARGLIDAGQHAKTLKNLSPLRADLLPLMKSYTTDPALFRDIEAWPALPGRTDAGGNIAVGKTIV